MTNSAGKPWYKEPWPWLLMGLTGSAVVASLITLAIAINNPDILIISDKDYQELRDDLRPSGPEGIPGKESPRGDSDKPPSDG